MKVIDNWLDRSLAVYLQDFFQYRVPHWWGHVSNPEETNMMYNCDLNINDGLNGFLFAKLCTDLNERLRLRRMYLNIQHPGMNGEFHTDDGDLTCLYMVVGEGPFEIKNEGKTKFIENRLIAFNAKKWHKGNAPKKGIRITLAFKCDRMK
tara:strand:+ start:2119 stop:2568 length:450 start_codon:yes stop_codon:yes gene_type:complete